MKVLRVSADAWGLACRTALDEVGAELPIDVDLLRDRPAEARLQDLDAATTSELWGELVTAGFADSRGLLEQAWWAAIVSMLGAEVTVRVAAHHGDVAFISDLTLDGPRGMSVVRRHLTGPGHDGSLRFVADEAAVEIALFRADDLWPAVRRTLPPLDALRAEPRPTPWEGRERLALSDEDVAAFQAALEADGHALRSPGQILESVDTLDPELRQVLIQPEATVSVLAVAGRSTQTEGAMGAAGGGRVPVREDVPLSVP